MNTTQHAVVPHDRPITWADATSDRGDLVCAVGLDPWPIDVRAGTTIDVMNPGPLMGNRQDRGMGAQS